MSSRFKTLYNDVLVKAKYGHNPNFLPKWDKSQKAWLYPSDITSLELDCTTSVNFILAYMLDMGESYDPNVRETTLPKAAAGITPFSGYFQKLGLKLLQKPNLVRNPAVGIDRLARGGSSYSKVDDWYYSKMPWGMEKEQTCKCELHLSPKHILNLKNNLSTVNIASVSVANSPAVYDELTPVLPNQHRTIIGRVTNKDNRIYWEYSMMFIFKLNNQLYVYHHTTKENERWRTFEQQCKAYIEIDKKYQRFQDSLWLVWSLPDSELNDRNLNFFKDSTNKRIWLP